MNITIRQATTSDLSDVLVLYAQPGLDDGKVMSEVDAKKVFSLYENYPNYRLFVAEDGQDIVGSYALLVMHNLAHYGTPSAIAEDVVVAHHCHGQGVGRKLMAHAMAQAQQAGCYKLALSSNLKRKDAHAFYESLGFKQHGISFGVDL